MIRSAALINSLLLRAALVAALTVTASSHSIALQIIGILGLLSLIVYLLYWVLDDWMIEKFRLSQSDYYAQLICSGIATLAGIGMGLWIIF
jgi:hypothetical protein